MVENARDSVCDWQNDAVINGTQRVSMYESVEIPQMGLRARGAVSLAVCAFYRR